MKLFTGSLAAGLALLAGAAQAQAPGRYTAASDFDAPYAEAPHAVPGPQYGAGPRYGYGPGPGLLPSTEVYSVLRDNGFSPLGIPRLRGFVYTIAVIDRGGEDGRLVIDARNGRIIRFLPADRMGDNYYEDQSALRGPFVGQPPRAQPPQAQPPLAAEGAPDQIQAAPRPSRPAHVASRSVPMPKASPLAAAKPAPAPVQQAEAPASKSADKAADAQATASVTTGSAPAKPVPSIAPTQDMPKAQGLE
jgi:hypothetical protein